MAVAGSLTYDTKIDKNGFEKGINSLKTSTNSAFSQIKNIVTALGIDKLISGAFNIINNSIDGAISRIDTLNNYPKVMSNLGIASEDSQKSISKMSDKLSGLPTTLNDGALAVQRFTSANGNIEKSTDYFLALNNALLAGGASTDIQATALEQLSQAYAKGKPDMMEWRSLQTAMPAQLKQVAGAFNMTSDELGQALRSGKISMDDFMDKIVELNANGTGEFQSFEAQAKNSTGGIATSITVAKTQVVKGVADIIQSLDKTLKDNGLGGIGEIISNIGKKAKEVLNSIAQKLPSIIKFLKKIAPLIATITTAFVIFKGALAIKGIIDSVKKSFISFNSVLMANPILAVVSLIIGLVAGFIYLWNTSEDFRNFWIGMWEGIKSAFINVWNAISGFFTEIIPNIFNNFVSFIQQIPQKILGFFVNCWNSIVAFFTETIPQWIQKVIDWFANLPYMIGYQIGQIIGHMIRFGINIWEWITEELPKIIQAIIQWFTELPGNIWNWLCKVVSDIIVWGQNMWINATTVVSNMVNAVIDWFAQLPRKDLDMVSKDN